MMATETHRVTPCPPTVREHPGEEVKAEEDAASGQELRVNQELLLLIIILKGSSFCDSRENLALESFFVHFCSVC